MTLFVRIGLHRRMKRRADNRLVSSSDSLVDFLSLGTRRFFRQKKAKERIIEDLESALAKGQCNTP